MLIFFFFLQSETNATCFDETTLTPPVSERISTLCLGREMIVLVPRDCESTDEEDEVDETARARKYLTQF